MESLAELIQDPSYGSVVEKSVILILSTGRLGRQKTVDNDKVLVPEGTDKSMVHASKTLFDSPEFKEIERLDNDLRDDLGKVGVALKRSVIFLPVSEFARAGEIIEDYLKIRAAAVEKFVGAYETAKADARSRLGTYFDESDYFTSQEVRESFTFSPKIISFGDSALKSIDQGILKRVVEKVDAEVRDAMEEVRDVLRYAMTELVDFLLDRLTGFTEDGKPKTIRQDGIDKVFDFMATFESRNIANDDELQGLVEEAKKILSGVDAGKLRTSRDVKAAVVSGMSGIKDKLDSMLVNRPRRQLSFD